MQQRKKPIMVFGGALFIKCRNLESSISLSDILIRDIEYLSSDANAFIRDVFPLPGEPKNKYPLRNGIPRFA